MANILILGGGGFIGSNLCLELLQLGHNVRIFERPNVTGLLPLDVRTKLEWIEGDVSNPADVDAAFEGQHFVYQLVSTTLPKSSNDNPVYDIESNVISTVRILESASQHHIKKVIFVSSGGTVYGLPQQIPIPESHPTEPICSYGITKLAIEKYLSLFNHLYGLKFTVLRLSNPYGRYQRPVAAQGAIAVFLHRALIGEPINIWGNGTIVRDFIYIEDVVEALVRSLSYSGNETIFNVGNGLGTDLNQVVEAIRAVVDRPVAVNYWPARVLDVPSNVLDISRISRELNWEPRINLVTGIRRTAEHWLEQGTN